MLSRVVPSGVARQLRAEAGFGCAICGNPILEYHHIIPWAERQHYDADHMVALCRNHHQEIGKQAAKVAYAAKANPINIRSKRFKGYLVTNKARQGLVLGNTRFVGFGCAVGFYGIPLFGHSIFDGEIRLNCLIPDVNLFPEVKVSENNIEALTSGFWDIDFKSNYVKFRRKKGEIFLEFDFRKDDVEIRGRFEMLGRKFEFSPTKSDFGGGRIEHLTLEGPPDATAIAHGDAGVRLLLPNYAMAVPKPEFYRV